jgi:predicted transcriptional regulator of viral defense system
MSRFALPELLAAPYPAYVSMQSALFHHGLIEQIPEVVYAATLARPRRIDTPLATVSLHRLPPELFTGFELSPDDGAKIATPEKALFDVFYLSQGRSRLFVRLPELEIPGGFRWRALRRYARLVKSQSRRSAIEHRIDQLAPQSVTM